MTRKIGDYIHLHWQNYYDHGTYRNSEKNNNYSADLFTAHYEQIKRRVQQQAISPEKREKIAQEYNARNQEAWKLFKDLLKDKTDPKNRSVLEYLLKEINKKWNDPAFINEIIAGLEWSDAQATFIYKPTASFTGSSQKSLSGWPAIRASSTGEFHEFQTIKDAVEKAQIYISSVDGDMAKQDLIRLKAIEDRLNQEETTLKAWDKTERQLWQLTNNKNASAAQAKFATSVLKKLFNNYIIELNAMRSKYSGAEEINRQIQAALAEIFGNVTAKYSPDIAKDAFAAEIKKAISVGRAPSKKSATSTDSIMSLSVNAIELELENDPDLKNILQKSGETADGRIKYSMTELGAARAQKRDVSLTIEAENYGISVKNTDITNAYMSYDDQKGRQKSSTISLQDSSLMLYLVGMEQDYPGYATHYLNALSQHPDVQGMAHAQAQALQNLKLYTLYSALTGRGQMRDVKGAAQILAIYDKAKNSPSRVRLYDMSEIIMAIEETDFTQGVKFKPALNESFLLKNEKIDAVERDNGLYRQPVEARLTNVLLEARRKNIAASLYTAWLRDSIKAF